MSVKTKVAQNKELDKLLFDSQANLPFLPSFSHDELISVHGKDSGLETLFKAVQPNNNFKSMASGYFVRNGTFIRKWTSCSNYAVGKPIFQVIIPKVFRELVFKTAHGNVAGHQGVKKTYHSVMSYCLASTKKRCDKIY